MRLLAIVPFLIAVKAPAEGNEKKVMAFYYTWYGNPEVSGAWLHWPEGGHNPEKTLPNGLPDTGTTNHPSLGLYDSMDPELMKAHLEMARQAGIDVFICTWWRQKDRHDQVFEKLLAVAAKTPVKLTVYYETIPERAPDRARDDLEYITSRYASHPAFFRFEGKPVIFIYGRAMNQIRKSEWEGIAREFRKKDVLLMADSRKPVDGFLGTHVYNPVVSIIQDTDMGAFYREDAEAARDKNQVYAATIIPGYDDSNIGRKTPIVADRKDGVLYEEQWRDALSADPDWIIITSWNELHEGSEIEPTHEDGTKYLDATKRWNRIFKTGRYITIDKDRETVASGDPINITLKTRAKGNPDFDISPAPFELRGTQAREQGFVLKVKVPEDLEPGEYPLEIKGSIDEEPLPPATVGIQVVRPVTCALQAVGLDWPNDREAGVTCLIRNHRTHPIDVDVELDAQAVDGSSEIHQEKTGFKLPELARWIFLVPDEFAKALLFHEPKPLVRVTVRERGRTQAATDEARLPVAITLRARSGCVCDGSLDEWEGVPFSFLDELRYRNRGVEEEVDPITAKVMTMWDKDNFYVAVEVRDRVHHQTLNGFYVWQEDNVQIAFDPLLDGGDEYHADDREFGLTLTKDGPEVWRWTPPLEPGDRSLERIQCGISRNAGKTVYEAALPWDIINEGVEPDAGSAFGFSLAVNNASPDKPSGALMLSEGIIFAKKPSKYPKWTLVESVPR